MRSARKKMHRFREPDKMWGEKKYVFVWYLTISSLTQTKETGQTLLQEKD